jgi:hypothetical protein
MGDRFMGDRFIGDRFRWKVSGNRFSAQIARLQKKQA